jgi:chemotaxis signal transduction protein
MSESASFLLVRAGGRTVGLPVEYLIGVAEIGPASPVPSAEPAMRGVAGVRGETMAVIHLGALLGGTACPTEPGQAGVVVSVGGVRLCLEVDEADVVVREALLPLPPASALPWARAVVRRPDGLVPLLDLSALGARLAEAGANT